MTHKYLKPVSVVVLALALSACGGGDEEDGYGKRPNTLAGLYQGQIQLVETSCLGVPAGKQLSPYWYVDRSGEDIALDDAGKLYGGKVLSNAYGFQATGNEPDGYSIQYTATYSGTGSKFDATVIYVDRRAGCSGKYAGTVVHHLL